MATLHKRSKLLKDFDKALTRRRFPDGWRKFLLLPYIPFGLILLVLRLCMSLQALLLLAIFPVGKIKRFMLRVYLGVLGIIVTTNGDSKHPKVFVANKVSYMDQIVFHLATDCVTMDSSPLLTFLLPHYTLLRGSDQSVVNHVRALPIFNGELIGYMLESGCASNGNAAVVIGCSPSTPQDSPADYTPLLVQPESLPQNGSHMLLKFKEWPFMLNCDVQPLAVRSYRYWPIKLTTVTSSGWWDLFWTLCVPFTYFNVKFLPCSQCGVRESPGEFSVRIQNSIATTLGLKALSASEEDVSKWIAGSPKPPSVSTQAQPTLNMPNGPVIPTSEFNPDDFKRSSVVGGAEQEPASPEVEVMVQQVTAVMPHVPHTAIRRDLLSTQSVDLTITNILDGHVTFTPLPNLQELAEGVEERERASQLKGGSELFRGPNPKSVHLSQQRQMSLEERKVLLLEQARRRYVEKHNS